MSKAQLGLQMEHPASTPSNKNATYSGVTKFFLNLLEFNIQHLMPFVCFSVKIKNKDILPSKSNFYKDKSAS